MPLFPSGRRRKIVVDGPFQYRATFIGIVYILAVAVCLSLPLFNMMRSTGVLLDGTNHELLTVYHQQRNYTIISLGVFFVGILSAWIVFTLWRTHKIAGPIVKMTGYIHSIAAGRFTDRLQLRSTDELQGLADALNGMAEGLQEREETIRGEILGQLRVAKKEMATNPSMDRGVEVIDRLVTKVNQSFESKPADDEAPVETAGEYLAYTES